MMMIGYDFAARRAHLMVVIIVVVDVVDNAAVEEQLLVMLGELIGRVKCLDRTLSLQNK